MRETTVSMVVTHYKSHSSRYLGPSKLLVTLHSSSFHFTMWKDPTAMLAGLEGNSEIFLEVRFDGLSSILLV